MRNIHWFEKGTSKKFQRLFILGFYFFCFGLSCVYSQPCEKYIQDQIKYEQSGEQAKAIANAKTVKDCICFNHGRETMKCVTKLRELGVLYTKSALYEEAIIALQEASEVLSKIGVNSKSEEEFTEYILIKTSLFLCFTGLLDLKEAIRTMEEVVGFMMKEVEGEENSLITLNLRISMASLYIANNEYEKADSIINICKDLIEKNYGKYNTEYFTSIILLIFNSRNSPSSAPYSFYQNLVEEALEVLEVIYQRDQKPEDHIDRLINLSETLKLSGQFDLGLKIIELGLDFMEEKRIEDKFRYSRLLKRRAYFYSQKGKIAEALNDYEITNKLFKNKFQKNKNIIGYLHFLSLQAQLSYMNNEFEKAEKSFSEANGIIFNSLNQFYSISSEKDRLIFSENFEAYIDMFYSFAIQRFKQKRNYSKELIQVSLIKDGLSLSYDQQLRDIIFSQNDPELSELFFNYAILKNQLAETILRSSENRYDSEIEDSFLAQINLLEAQLISKAPDIQNLVERSQALAIKDFEQKLQKEKKSAVIDFVDFQYYDFHNWEWSDSILYYAVLALPHTKNPEFIFLGEQKEIEKALEFKIEGIGENKTEIYSYLENVTISNDLYQKVWKPLEPYLEGIQTIHLSPSGLLNKIAFDALQVDNDITLGDKFDIHYYGHIKDWVLKEEKENIRPSIALFGGAKFDLDEEEIRKLEDNTVKLNRTIPRNSIRNKKIEYLKGTKEEVEEIGALFREKNWETQIFTGNQATEGRIKQLNLKNSSGILHIATHGFFFEKPKTGKKPVWDYSDQDQIQIAENPMLRSGLLLTGSNHAWQGNPPLKGLENGILTSYEISGMNLLNTDLVVLSACETGLGDIHSEGVLGLQRAFNLAGVNTMIVSLWKVDDDITKQLMKVFYQNYLYGMNKRDALKAAQMEIRSKYSPPYFWAGFILIE